MWFFIMASSQLHIVKLNISICDLGTKAHKHPADYAKCKLGTKAHKQQPDYATLGISPREYKITHNDLIWFSIQAHRACM